jgi:hypothetical protein
MPQLLPSRPSLEHIRKQAKQLLKALHNGETQSFERAYKIHRRFRKLTPGPDSGSVFKLNDAQYVVARENGFDSWSRMRSFVLEVNARRVGTEGREARVKWLMECAGRGQKDPVLILIKDDPSLLTATGEHDFTAVHCAVESGSMELVEALLDAGAGIDFHAAGSHSPLSWAVTVGKLKMAQLLVDRGAPVDLWCAAGLGLLDCVKGFGGRVGAGSLHDRSVTARREGPRVAQTAEW